MKNFWKRGQKVGINEQCTSYDDGDCATSPFTYSVKCEDLNCRWKNPEELEKEAKRMKNKYCEIQDDCKVLKDTVNQYNAVVQQNKELQSELQPFRQPYFKGLTTAVIAELAKSQIKTVAQNINAQTLIDYIEQTITNAGTENAIRIIKQEIER